MNAYTQLIDGVPCEEPSLDPQVFDPENGPIVRCKAVYRDTLTIEEAINATAILTLASGERKRLESI